MPSLHDMPKPVGDDIEQRLDTLAADRSDDPELGKVGPDQIGGGAVHSINSGHRAATLNAEGATLR